MSYSRESFSGEQPSENSEKLSENPKLTLSEARSLYVAVESGALVSVMSPEDVTSILKKLKSSIEKSEQNISKTIENLVYGKTNRYMTISNSTEMHKKGANPQFRIDSTDQNSEYFMDENGLIIPKPRSVFSIGQMKSGGAEYLFDIQDFRQGYRYRKVEVVRPARMDEQGQLIEKGILRVSEEEREM